MVPPTLSRRAYARLLLSTAWSDVQWTWNKIAVEAVTVGLGIWYASLGTWDALDWQAVRHGLISASIPLAGPALLYSFYLLGTPRKLHNVALAKVGGRDHEIKLLSQRLEAKVADAATASKAFATYSGLRTRSKTLHKEANGVLGAIGDTLTRWKAQHHEPWRTDMIAALREFDIREVAPFRDLQDLSEPGMPLGSRPAHIAKDWRRKLEQYDAECRVLDKCLNAARAQVPEDVLRDLEAAS